MLDDRLVEKNYNSSRSTSFITLKDFGLLNLLNQKSLRYWTLPENYPRQISTALKNGRSLSWILSSYDSPVWLGLSNYSNNRFSVVAFNWNWCLQACQDWYQWWEFCINFVNLTIYKSQPKLIGLSPDWEWVLRFNLKMIWFSDEPCWLAQGAFIVTWVIPFVFMIVWNLFIFGRIVAVIMSLSLHPSTPFYGQSQRNKVSKSFSCKIRLWKFEIIEP